MEIEPKQSDWGPQAWSFIHYVALAYPDNPTEEDKKYYKNFYVNLQNVLPCKTCASNYKKNIDKKSVDPALSGKEELFKWTIDIHNMVNIELDKRKYSYEEVFNEYFKDTSNDKNDIIIKLACFILFILLGYLILKHFI